jgi:hypothetical protein
MPINLNYLAMFGMNHGSICSKIRRLSLKGLYKHRFIPTTGLKTFKSLRRIERFNYSGRVAVQIFTQQRKWETPLKLEHELIQQS